MAEATMTARRAKRGKKVRCTCTIAASKFRVVVSLRSPAVDDDAHTRRELGQSHADLVVGFDKVRP